MVFASAGFRATGKFRPTTAPDSMRSSNAGRTRPLGSAAQGLPSYRSFGGQKTRRTSGSVSNRERKTAMPWTILVLTSERKNFDCADCHTHAEDDPGDGLFGLAFAVGEHQSADNDCDQTQSGRNRAGESGF